MSRSDAGDPDNIISGSHASQSYACADARGWKCARDLCTTVPFIAIVVGYRFHLHSIFLDDVHCMLSRSSKQSS